ncbi:methyltransferase domain-containing protein [uncultured Roseobacter sp.]|uniref:class I SAM-dependent DNA methyltransferase n=1 Tax=uncultured Roseobacter sp. TaxID=114847 RepID=UPI002608D7EE|nr:methyltransferase domain-containing protein [uncultured Roseobacter sp.]
MKQTYLDKVYAARDVSSTRKLYDDWSDSYDDEVTGQGYATPARCAEALASFTKDFAKPVLDFGCGTGLSGEALSKAGFQTIDGLDLSREMLDQAAGKKIYRELRCIDAGGTLAHSPGTYAAIAAIGVIGAGAAPVSLFHVLMNGLGSGDRMVFSYNDHALEDPSYEAALCEWVDCGSARLLFREHGPHLPGIGLKSNVYVVEKA